MKCNDCRGKNGLTATGKCSECGGGTSRTTDKLCTKCSTDRNECQTCRKTLTDDDFDPFA